MRRWNGSTMFDTLADSLTEIIKVDDTIDSQYAHMSGRLESYLISNLHDIIQFHCELIEQASSTIILATSFWESKSQAAYMINRSLQKAFINYPSLKVRIIVDNGNFKNFISTGVRIIPKTKFSAELGLDIDPEMDVMAKSIHKQFLGTMHAKFMLVDHRIAVLSSNNIQDRSNLELAVSLSGDICTGFSNIFWRLWTQDTHLSLGSSYYCSCSTNINDTPESIMFVNRRSNGSLINKDIHTPQNYAWWLAMSLAHKSVVICSPTFNAYHAIEAVYNVCMRNIPTTLILTRNFNDKKEALPFQGGTNLRTVRKLYRRLRKRACHSHLQVRWFVGQGNQPRIGIHSHVKFMTVDDELVILGNANMDTQSWYHSMEVNIALRSSSLSRSLVTVMTKQSVAWEDLRETHYR
jgi:phosphatidylserine/phosphatidylglycerophosphate/cardiolipin synthase-like enzyme